MDENRRLPACYFTIVTPSYNMLGYLKRCVASVVDQEFPGVQHIIMDASSQDGTSAWLATQPNLQQVCERDRGMYDALNKGFSRAKGDLFGYLNCDEQYLPGSLEFVADYFATHPEVDVLFGDALLIQPDGSHVAYRKGIPPRWPYILASHLYLHSCSMFFRARIFAERHRFDDRYRTIADMAFVVDLLKSGYRCAHVRRYLAAFTITGMNMGASDAARREHEEYLKNSPRWIRLFAPFLNACRIVEKAVRGCYYEAKPLEYSVYTSEGARKRTEIVTLHPSFRWKQGEV